MRALVVSNMLADARRPERGRFVRDQLAALRDLGGAEIELYELPPGKRELAAAALRLRRRYARGEPFDVVHAHFGLTAWPALAVPARVRALTMHGTDLSDPRSRRATLAVLGRIELPAVPSAALLTSLPAPIAARTKLLPVGVDTARFRPLDRARSRAEHGLAPDRPYLLFPAAPARAEKRHDLARVLAEAAGAELLVLGGVSPEAVPTWVNAANAVLVPSDREGFGLAVLEALACDVPVLATPVGVHAEALRGIEGTLCAPFEIEAWSAAVRPALQAADPRVSGRTAAERFSALACAQRVLDAWEGALAHPAAGSG